jgi:multidrug transporter EmrE-like cation transporter
MIIASLLLAVIALTVYGQLIIKARAIVHTAEYAGGGSRLDYLFAMFTDFRVISGLVAALIAGACWMLAIQRLDVGYAYPFMALSFVAVPIGSNLFLGEPLPMTQFTGLLLIIAGVSVSALSR